MTDLVTRSLSDERVGEYEQMYGLPAWAAAHPYETRQQHVPAFAADSPISNVRWLDPLTDLDANNYNPNIVQNAELDLLKLSLLKQGWVQPILITADGTIIDGFHRATLCRTDRQLRARYPLIPCAVLPISRPEAMLLTIRINRAKGTHAALSMSKIVKELVNDHGLTKAAIATEIGGTVAEVELLLQSSLFKAKDLKDYKFSKAWVPASPTGKRGK